MEEYKRIVCIGSSPVQSPLSFFQSITHEDFVVAIDGGFSYLLAQGIQPNLVLGDFDSVDLMDLQAIETGSFEKIFLPTEKDETDFEIAIQYILEHFNCTIPVFLLNMTEGRPDHAITTLFATKKMAEKGFSIFFAGKAEDIYIVPSNQRIEINKSIGTILSIFPLNEVATGVTTQNLQYPLHNETLYQESSRGISNVFTGKKCTIMHKNGILAIYVFKEK